MKISLKVSGIHVLESETLQATLEEVSVTRTVKIGKAEICDFSSNIRNALGSTEYWQEERAWFILFLPYSFMLQDETALIQSSDGMALDFYLLPFNSFLFSKAQTDIQDLIL